MKISEFKQAIYAGLLAGILFLVVEIMLIPIFTDGTGWQFPRMMAAFVLGKDVLPPAASFDLGIVFVGSIVHLALSAFYAVILGLFIHLSNLTASIIVGIIYGLILYYINYYLFGSVFTWMEESKHWIHLVASMIFGGAAGLIFKELQSKSQRCENC